MCARLDVLLSYDTPKILQIQDRRVGLCYYGVIGLIFCYVFFFMVLWQKRYLLAESPSGSVRFSLLQPAVSTPVEQLGYCRGGSASNSSVPCLYWDESDVVVAGLEEDALLITTRLSPVHQQLPANCTQRAPDCRYRTVVDGDGDGDAKFFVADIERFTLMIEHSYEARAVGLEGTSVALPGEVADEQGQLLALPNSQVGVAGQQDIFTVADLLAAAGIASLDSPSLANPARTMRDDGVVLTMHIEYSNTWSFDLSRVRYRYILSQVDGTKFKTVQLRSSDRRTGERWLDDRHGVRLIIRQGGQLGRFDFPTLLLTLVSGAALVSVAKLVVDTAILYWTPLRNKYGKLKFEETTPADDFEVIEPDVREQINDNDDEEERR